MFMLPMPAGLAGSPDLLASSAAQAADTLVNALHDGLQALLMPLLWLPLLSVLVLTTLVLLRSLRARGRLAVLATAVACVVLLPQANAQAWLQDMTRLALSL